MKHKYYKKYKIKYCIKMNKIMIYNKKINIKSKILNY